MAPFPDESGSANFPLESLWNNGAGNCLHSYKHSSRLPFCLCIGYIVCDNNIVNNNASVSMVLYFLNTGLHVMLSPIMPRPVVHHVTLLFIELECCSL